MVTDGPVGAPDGSVGTADGPVTATDGPAVLPEGPAGATDGTRGTGRGPGPRAEGEPVRFAAAVMRGTALAELGDYAGAEAVLRGAIRVHEAVHGPDDPRLALPLRALAATRAARGGLAEAERLSLRVLALVQGGAGHPAAHGAAAVPRPAPAAPAAAAAAPRETPPAGADGGARRQEQEGRSEQS
ncbi:tetratricopeptide repeat protein [Kitasatospora indigofera]|uniref:tetratricopeptide repeat protein n=1 Tax=Kitasatospora indigofera TaxID=67307 RepID=UPI0036278A9C